MGEPYKEAVTRQYTEYVYYDADGNAVGWERMEDDHAYDAGPRIPITDEELEEARRG